MTVPAVPPAYPRIPHLVGSQATRDDRQLTTAANTGVLREADLVEEKLDGANMRLRLVDGQLEILPRGKRATQDRSGQLGRLRAWAGERWVELERALAGGVTIYVEWLWLRHSVPYDALESYVTVLDVWKPEEGFLAHEPRLAWADGAGIPTPPVVYDGDPGGHSPAPVASAYYDGPAEGLVFRRKDAGLPLAKWVDPGFVRKPDSAWRGAPEFNELKQTTDQGDDAR